MAWANSTISDIIATTIQSRSKEFADNLTNNNALLYRLKSKKNVKKVSGGSSIFEEIMYNDPETNFAQSYSGYELLNVSQDSPLSSAEFLLKLYADPVTISGEQMLKNSGEEEMIDLMASRIDVAYARLQNKIDLDLHGDGTGNGGKDIVGLAAMIAADPTTGVYGGIDRSTWSFWRNASRTATSITGGAATASTIQKCMNTVILSLVRGNDSPDFVYAGGTAYELYLESLQAIQRVTTENGDMAGAGFTALKYYSAGKSCDVILGGGLGGNCVDTNMYFINSKYVFFRPHADRNFVSLGKREAINQDAVCEFIGWAGALTSSGAQFNGLLSTL